MMQYSYAPSPLQRARAPDMLYDAHIYHASQCCIVLLVCRQMSVALRRSVIQLQSSAWLRASFEKGHTVRGLTHPCCECTPEVPQNPRAEERVHTSTDGSVSPASASDGHCCRCGSCCRGRRYEPDERRSHGEVG